ncbi:MAG: HlyD family efflux transporter periplasmic adaptor subunit, partial [Bacteroidetes bacterium]|nr:HlyD family efflux transporter periplasmic adaptor subunit [Bacteroidota bacterium]
MIHELKKICSSMLMILVLSSCGNKTKETPETALKIGTPVTVISVGKSSLKETIELNATSQFLLKTPVKSPANGYLQNVRIKQGDFVKKGEILMSVITKEAQAIGGTINTIDTSFHFKGEINITAPGNGYISQLNFQTKDYVQDGEQVAMISDSKSFVFILDLPYELTSLLKSNQNVLVILPDSSKLNGIIEKSLPTVDATSQTQNYVITTNNNSMIPENLVAKVLLVKSSKQNVTAIPKEAILSNETQNKFWVM